MMSYDNQIIPNVCAAVGLFHLAKKLTREVMRQLTSLTQSENWEIKGMVVSLNLLPIKYGPPMMIDRGFCSAEGLVSENLYDRMFFIVNRAESNKVCHRLKYPLLDRITISRSSGTFQPYDYENSVKFQTTDSGETLLVNLMVYEENPVHISDPCSGMPVKCMDLGNDVAKWIQYVLGTSDDIRMMYCPINCRMVSEAYLDRSYLMLSDSTMYALRTSLELPPVVLPNILWYNIGIKTKTPFIEDSWDIIRLGDAVFRMGERGIRKNDEMPSQTNLETPIVRLSSFMDLKVAGHVKVGDNVEVLGKTYLQRLIYYVHSFLSSF